MEKNSSCSRVLAWLVVHQIAELQLTAPLQKSATKFYNRPRYFFQIRSKISEAGTLSLCCSGEAPVSIQ